MLVLVLFGFGFGGYLIYAGQKERNTAALLADAKRSESEADWSRASMFYRRYLRRVPKDVDALRSYARVLFERTKKEPEALGDTLAVLRRLANADPTDTEALSRLSGLCLLLREFRAAEELASNWIQQAPDSPEAVLTLARAQLGLGNPQEAVTTLVTSLQKVQASPLYPLLVEILARDLKQPEEAAVRLAEALTLAPKDPQIQLCAFLFQQNGGERTKAAEHLQHALEFGADSLPVQLTAARFFLAESRQADAATALERATQIAPDDRRVLMLRAFHAKQRGDPALLTAIAEDIRARSDENDTEMILVTTELFLQANQWAQVDQNLLALASVPGSEAQFGTRIDTLRGMRELHAARPLVSIGHLLRGLERDPAHVPALQVLAKAYMLTGDMDSAEEACRRLATLRPLDFGIRLSLADLAWRRAGYVDARAAVMQVQGMGETQQMLARLVELAADLGQAKESGRSQIFAKWQDRPKAETLAKDNAAAALWLIRCMVLAGAPADALNLWRSGDLPSETLDAIGVELARLLLADRQNDWALTLAKEWIARDPNSVEAHRLRIVSLSTNAPLADVERQIDSATLPTEGKAVLRESLADLILAAGQTDTALVMYRDIADTVPSNVTSRQKIIQFTPEWTEANKRSEELRELEGPNAFRWKFELAGAILRLKPEGEEPSRAVSLLQECLARRPRWGAARTLLGRAFELTEQWYDAAEAYRTALAHQPSLLSSTMAVHYAELLTRLGRMHEAQSILNSLSASLAREPRVLRLWMEQQIRDRDYRSAQSTAERLLQLQPDNPVWPALQADLQLRLNNPQQAETIARTALLQRPSSIPLLLALTRALLAQGRGIEALEQVTGAADQVKDGAHYLLLASVASMLGQEALLESAVDQAESFAQEDSNIWAACAEFWGRQGRRDRRLIAVRKVLYLREEDPSESLLWAGVTAESGSKKDLLEANEIIHRCLEKKPDDPQTLILAAKFAGSSIPPNLTQAESLLERALAFNPLINEARSQLIAVQFSLGRLEDARGTLRVGLAVAPDDTELLLAAARLHLFVREYGQAIAAASHLLSLQPRSPEGLQILAVASERSGQVKKTIEFIQSRIPENLTTTDEWIILSGLIETDGDVSRAESLLRRAAETDTPNGRAHRALIRFLTRRNNFFEIHSLTETRRAQFPLDVESWVVAAEAMSCACSHAEQREQGERWLDEIAQQEPKIAADLHYRSARCFYQCGELDRAEKRFIEAIHILPTHSQTVNDLAWLYAEDLGRPDEALAILDKFVSVGGKEDAHLLDTRGLALLRLGKSEAAESCLNACLRVADSPPTRTSATYHLGLLHWSTDRKSQAASFLRQAFSLNRQFGGLSSKQLQQCRDILDPSSMVQDPPSP
ncbi:MAG: tetratricopeptide repeat protein [Planctomycetota bacterium]